MVFFDDELFDTFVKSSYFTEKNLLSNLSEIVKLLDFKNEAILISKIKEIPDEIAPNWLKSNNRSDELKLFFELQKGNSGGTFNFEPDGDYKKESKKQNPEVFNEIYD